MLRTMSALALAAATLAVPAQARPVSYPGGWTVMQLNDDRDSSIHLHYSPTARYSLGWREQWARDDGWVFTGGQANRLLRRWNRPSSQANLYLKGALGVVGAEDRPFSDVELGGMAEIAADWETRRWFTSAAATYWDEGAFGESLAFRARLGVAPYIGDFGDLHTWLMVEAAHRPDADDTLVVTPMLRFFRGVQLVEIGVTDQGEGLFNWIIRF